MCYVSYETVHFEWVWLQNLNEPTGGNITPTTVTGILLQSKKYVQHTIKLQFVIVKVAHESFEKRKIELHTSKGTTFKYIDFIFFTLKMTTLIYISEQWAIIVHCCKLDLNSKG